MSSWTQLILIGLCHSFKVCAQPPSLLFHALGGKYSIISNPLILPNTGHTGDLGDAQTPVRGVPGGHHALTCLGIGLRKVVTPQPVWGSSSPRGPRRSSRLDLPGTQSSGGRHISTFPGIRSLGGCHASVCLGICTLTRGCLALRLQQY